MRACSAAVALVTSSKACMGERYARAEPLSVENLYSDYLLRGMPHCAIT